MARPRTKNIDNDNIKNVVEVIDEVTPINNDNSLSEVYNPFHENVIEREYSAPPLADASVSEIDEPKFSQPTYEEIIAERNQETEENSFQEQEQQKEPSPFNDPNPALKDLSDKEKELACENLVDSLLFGYEQLHIIAVNYAKISDDKIIELKTTDSLDFSETIPISEDGDEVTIDEYFTSFNEQVAKSLSYDNAFDKKVRPALTRVFLMKGWGMSDVQFLAIEFGKDLMTKGAMFFSLKKSLNLTIDLLVQAYAETKNHRRSKVREDEYDIEAIDEDEYDEIEEVEKAIKVNRQPVEVKEEFKIDYPTPVKVTPLPKDIQD